MKKLFSIIACVVICTSILKSQDDLLNQMLNENNGNKKEYVSATFKGTRLINGHTVETTKKKALDFLITHRFGDMGVKGVSGHTLLGIDNASDIQFVFEYGVTDDLTLGISRSQGAGKLRELYTGLVKYRVYKQTLNNKRPVTITLLGNATISSMKKQSDPLLISSFPKFNHRMSYLLQVMVARKFTDWLSVQATPTFLWRNLVEYNDNNALFFLGLSARTKITKRSAIIFEYYLPLMGKGQNYREYFTMVRGIKNAPYYPSLHIGYELETGGHVFHINLTNSEGTIENDFLPYTSKNWIQGGFRLGFTISRGFYFSKGVNAWTGKPKKTKTKE